MAKFAIVATFEIVQGQMEAFLPLWDRCLKDEPGTLRFDVLEENSVLLYEVYADDAAFQVHWNGPHVARMRAETTGMVTKLTGIRCSLLE